jgi:hypothetical protein
MNALETGVCEGTAHAPISSSFWLVALCCAAATGTAIASPTAATVSAVRIRLNIFFPFRCDYF